MKEVRNNRTIMYVVATAILGGLLLITYWVLGSPPSGGKNQAVTSPGLLEQLMPRQQTINANARDTKMQSEINSLIEGLTIIPKRPTVLDNLRVEVKAHNPEKGQLSYLYQWQINGKTVEGIAGDLLPAGLAKKNDRITVTAVPLVDGVEYRKFQYAANTLVYNVVPTFVLKEDTRTEGDFIELQLKAEDPDGDVFHYALAEPFIEGMTIDKNTGKITWKPARQQVGINRFGASVTDQDGIKSTKIFEFALNKK